ncbi:zinc finger, RING-type containing protein [Tanacetum coccineum]
MQIQTPQDCQLFNATFVTLPSKKETLHLLETGIVNLVLILGCSFLGVEPWTFEQYLGEAIFIPAGFPHQVRNRQSCIKVDLGFVSLDNVEECIRLTDEFRLLLKAHRSKEDKLEVVRKVVPATFRWERRAPDPLSPTQNNAR